MRRPSSAFCRLRKPKRRRAAWRHPPNCWQNERGVRMMARGVADQAQLLFSRAASANPGQPSIWANLASSLKALGRRVEEFDAIEKALALEPRHLSALLQKADYFV